MGCGQPVGKMTADSPHDEAREGIKRGDDAGKSGKHVEAPGKKLTADSPKDTYHEENEPGPADSAGGAGPTVSAPGVHEPLAGTSPRNSR
jgi:hypothetical protein